MDVYRYLISYASFGDGGQVIGRVDVDRPVPIRTSADVAGVERDLRVHRADPRLIVTAFSAYADADSPVGAS